MGQQLQALWEFWPLHKWPEDGSELIVAGLWTGWEHMSVGPDLKQWLLFLR